LLVSGERRCADHRPLSKVLHAGGGEQFENASPGDIARRRVVSPIAKDYSTTYLFHATAAARTSPARGCQARRRPDLRKSTAKSEARTPSSARIYAATRSRRASLDARQGDHDTGADTHRFDPRGRDARHGNGRHADGGRRSGKVDDFVGRADDREISNDRRN